MSNQPQIERVPLTPTEQEYFNPIWENFQQVQAQLNAVAGAFAASHREQLTPGQNDWQLTKEGFARLVPPAQNGNGTHEGEGATG